MGSTERSYPRSDITGMAPGAKTVDRAHPRHNTDGAHVENTGASDVKFTADDLKQFNQELAAISIKGLRLPQAVLNFSNVEAPAKQ